VREQEILRLAAEHFHAATDGKEIPDYGRWQEWARVMRKHIDGFASATEVLHYAQNARELPFSHREKANPELLEACNIITRNEFPWFNEFLDVMTDNPESLPETLIDTGLNPLFRERQISDMFFWHIYSLFTIRSHVPHARNVIEIGGGDGAMARLWCLYFPVDHYVIIDLPESLYFSEVNLRSIFGDMVAYCIDSVPIDAKILLVPAEKLERVWGASDVVLSIGSMQEMNDAWITRYMAWLDAHQHEYFYSLNYAGQPIKELGESRCWWGPRPSTEWSTKLLALNPAVVRIMCPNRHFLQALYRKFPCQGCLDTWSVLRGRALTHATYLEGLDLVRQRPIQADIELFMSVVLNSKTVFAHDWLPKEMVALADMVDCESSVVVKQYQAEHPSKYVD
jgi:hypothetical protein